MSFDLPQRQPFFHRDLVAGAKSVHHDDYIVIRSVFTLVALGVRIFIRKSISGPSKIDDFVAWVVIKILIVFYDRVRRHIECKCQPS